MSERELLELMIKNKQHEIADAEIEIGRNYDRIIGLQGRIDRARSEIRGLQNEIDVLPKDTP